MSWIDNCRMIKSCAIFEENMTRMYVGRLYKWRKGFCLTSYWYNFFQIRPVWPQLKNDLKIYVNKIKSKVRPVLDLALKRVSFCLKNRNHALWASRSIKIAWDSFYDHVISLLLLMKIYITTAFSWFCAQQQSSYLRFYRSGWYRKFEKIRYGCRVPSWY